MAELPKSVLQRLKQPRSQEHPDANLLAAFCEQSLTGREREGVLAHLATCADCREAVALAQGDMQQQPAVLMLPWYRRPQTFTWSAVAATLVVGAALVVNYRDRAVPESTRQLPARRVTPAVSAQQSADAAGAAREQLPKSNAKNEQLASRGEVQTEHRAKKTPDLAAKPQPGPEAKDLDAKRAGRLYADKIQTKGGALKDDGAGARRDEEAKLRTMSPAVAASAPQAPAASNMAVLAKEQPSAASTQTEQAQAAAPAAQKAVGGMVSAEVASSAQAVLKAQKSKVEAASRWTVSADGQLQRSSDSGRTWQTVTPLQGATFRAVAVIGSEVWAGGAAADLFHSSDGGQTWARQLLSGSTAAIVSLRFTDPQHGTAQCDDGATWVTTDGGQHWTKR